MQYFIYQCIGERLKCFTNFVYMT